MCKAQASFKARVRLREKGKPKLWMEWGWKGAVKGKNRWKENFAVSKVSFGQWLRGLA